MIGNLLNRFKKSTPTEPPALQLRREQLVPRIKHLNFIKTLQAYGIPVAQQPATTPLCGELLVTYAFDLPDQFVMATPEQLEQAGISVAEMPALALKNLAQGMPPPPRLRKQGCMDVRIDGQTEATLLLLDDFWQQIQAGLGGDIVATAPRRDRLLVCDAGDAGALELLDKKSQAAFTEVQDEHALSLQKMLRRDGRWELFNAH